MIKLQKNKLLTGTLRSYIISYISVVLLALALLSILTTRQIYNRMLDDVLRVTENKLYTVVEDMENQLNNMRGMTLKLSSMEELKPEYLQENKYHEIELSTLLKRYNNTSPIVDSFFVAYEGYENVFTSSGTTIPLKLYLRQYLIEEDYEEVISLIEKSGVEGKETFLLYKDESGPELFCFPLQRYAGTSNLYGVLCFVITEDCFSRRIDRIAGKVDGEFGLYYDEILMYGEHLEHGIVERRSSNGRIRAVFGLSEEKMHVWNIVLPMRELGVFAGIMIVLLVVAIFAAWYNYKPISLLIRKYKEMLEVKETADLDSIDMLIDSLLRKDERNSTMLQKQYHMLREQTIQLIAEGYYSHGIKERLTMLNLHLDMECFCLIHCNLHSPDRLEQYKDMLYSDVEKLSDEEKLLYPFWKENEKLTVLLCIKEEYQAEEVSETLRALFDAREIPAEVMQGRVCHDLHFINQSNEISSEKENVLPCKKNWTALRALSYIQSNCTKYDLSLDMVSQEFEITPSYLSRLIKQQTGKNYKEYLTELRIGVSKEMLKEEGASIAEVCQRVGYTNVSYFIKVFQKEEGITPARYRDEFQKMQQDE